MMKDLIYIVAAAAVAIALSLNTQRAPKKPVPSGPMMACYTNVCFS